MKFLLPLLTLLMLVGCEITSTPTTPKAPTPPTGEFDVHFISRPPVPVHQVAPVYPLEMRKRGITGEALIEFIVEPDGSVTVLRAVSATNEIFAKAAMACLQEWRFKPGRKDGYVVRTRMQLPIYFGMQEVQ